MMTFPAHLKKTEMPTQSRLMFDLENFKKTYVAGTTQAKIGGKVASPISLRDDDIDSMITTYNTAVTDTASEILEKERRRIKLCDERRGLKKKRYEERGAKEYTKSNKRVQKTLKKQKRTGRYPEQGD